MKREISIHLIYLVTAILLMGMLIAPLKKAAATNAYYQLADGITINPISGLITTEAGGTATFTVVLTSQPGSAVTIGLSSSDPTEGTVSPTSVTLNHGNWDTAQTVTVTGVDDSVIDGDVAYQIITAPAISNDPIYNGLDAADVSVTNQDNDVAGILANPASGLITSESGGSDSFTLVLNTQPSADVTFGLSSSNISEGTVSPTSVTFTPGNWDTAQTITVTGVDDLNQDGDVAYQIITAPASSGDLNYDGLDAADVSVTNQDNDVAGFTFNRVSGLVTSEAGGSDSFTVVLNIQPIADVTFGLSSSNTSEGTVSPASVTFTPVNWGTAQTVTVTGVDDPMIDGDVAYQIITAPASSGDLNYNGLDAADVSVTNQDNDVAGILANPASGLVTSEAGGSDSFTLVLNTQPSADVTFSLSSSNTSEGTVSPASVIFTPGNWDTAQSITVTGVDDLNQDGDVAYQIITAPASSGDLNYNGLDAADVSVTNQDNDVAGFTFNRVSGLVTSEAGGSDSFTVVLNIQPIADITFGLSSSDTTEAIISPIQVTFTSLNWDTPQVVTATGVDDQLDDGDQAYTIITSLATSGDPSYDGLNAPDVSGININNDFTPVGMQDSYLTSAVPNQPLIVDPPGVLSNDKDANNDPLIALKMSNPQKGVLDFDINGSFIYTPTQNFTQVETDSFSYVANDGTLESGWTTVEIMIDPIFPTINWVSPVTDGEIYDVNNQVVRLQADAADNLSIEQVYFFRWDALLEDYVDIGVVYNSPYQWDLDTRALHYGWNQIFARAKDTAGNNSTIPFIWIYRNFSPSIFLPFIAG